MALYLAPNNDGTVSPSMNNKYSLMNALEHEDGHQKDFKNIIKTTYKVHANVYLQAFGTDNFKKSSEKWQKGTIASFAKYTMNAYYQDGENVDDLISNFNSQNNGYKVNFDKDLKFIQVKVNSRKTYFNITYEKKEDPH